MLLLKPNMGLGSAKYLRHLSSIIVRIFLEKSVLQFIYWRNFRNWAANPSLAMRQINMKRNTWRSLFTLAECHANMKGLFVFLTAPPKPE